jgi:hypothetical protein
VFVGEICGVCLGLKEVAATLAVISNAGWDLDLPGFCAAWNSDWLDSCSTWHFNNSAL